MQSLGTLYAVGQGVPQDYGKASEWFHRAADAGNTDAMYNLGVLYRDGKGRRQGRWEGSRVDSLGSVSKYSSTSACQCALLTVISGMGPPKLFSGLPTGRYPPRLPSMMTCVGLASVPFCAWAVVTIGASRKTKPRRHAAITVKTTFV
jgi:hypothetical protein